MGTAEGEAERGVAEGTPPVAPVAVSVEGEIGYKVLQLHDCGIDTCIAVLELIN